MRLKFIEQFIHAEDNDFVTVTIDIIREYMIDHEVTVTENNIALILKDVNFFHSATVMSLSSHDAVRLVFKLTNNRLGFSDGWEKQHEDWKSYKTKSMNAARLVKNFMQTLIEIKWHNEILNGY